MGRATILLFTASNKESDEKILRDWKLPASQKHRLDAGGGKHIRSQSPPPMDGVNGTQRAADGKTGGATTPTYSPTVMMPLWRLRPVKQRKLEPDPRVAAGARAGASEGKTSVLSLEAKRSMIVKNAPVSNGQLAALVEVLVSTCTPMRSA